MWLKGLFHTSHRQYESHVSRQKLLYTCCFMFNLLKWMKHNPDKIIVLIFLTCTEVWLITAGCWQSSTDSPTMRPSFMENQETFYTKVLRLNFQMLSCWHVAKEPKCKGSLCSMNYITDWPGEDRREKQYNYSIIKLTCLFEHRCLANALDPGNRVIKRLRCIHLLKSDHQFLRNDPTPIYPQPPTHSSLWHGNKYNTVKRCVDYTAK